MSVELAHLRAVVMGGSKGIGKAISEALAAEGASLAVAARQLEPLSALKAELGQHAVKVHIGVCDVGDGRAVEEFIADAADALGGIDVLVNCASSFSKINSEAGWNAAFNVDLMGAVRATNAAVPYLSRSEYPSVVNISSVATRQAPAERLPYAAMKAALEQYTASAAVLYAPSRIRVNCLVAGSTEFAGGIWDRIRLTEPRLYEDTKKRIPLGGFATPCDIANGVVFLASKRAAWITGQSIVVDGGQTAGR
jgi:3-oxoacyl-[acyl-carrier protein] reductase